MTDQALLDARPLALAVAGEFFLPGGDRDDLEQEAMLALVEAARDYRTGHGATFATFARLVVRRRLADAVKRARAAKHLALTLAAREAVDEDGEVFPIVDLLPSGRGDPHETFELREELRRLRRGAKRLNALEREGLGTMLAGIPYAYSKRLDNAVARARAKLRAAK